MDRDWFSTLLEDIDPKDIAFRYISHASIVRHGQTEKLSGAALRRFMDGAPEFKDVHESNLAINWAYLLLDTEDEWRYVRTRVTELLLKKR